MRMRMFEIFHSQWSQGSFFNLRLQKSNSTGNKNHHQWQGRSELLVIRLIRFYVTLSVLKTAGCSGGFISPHLPHQVEIEFAQLLPVRTELSQEKLDNISTPLLSLQQNQNITYYCKTAPNSTFCFNRMTPVNKEC